jgi:hypothetical protein
MPSAAQALREEYALARIKLQEDCPHTTVSGWIEEQWAVGHGTGYQVKVCEECDKILEIKGHCIHCGVEVGPTHEVEKLLRCPSCISLYEMRQ